MRVTLGDFRAIVNNGVYYIWCLLSSASIPGDVLEEFHALLVSESFSEGGAQGISGLHSLRSYFEHGASMMAARVGDDVRVDPAVMVRVSFAAVLGCMLFKDWVFSGLPVDDDEISNAIMDFVLDGINANLKPGPEQRSATGHSRRKSK